MRQLTNKHAKPSMSLMIRALEKDKAQKRDKESQGWGGCALQSMVKKVLIDKVTFEGSREGAM